MGHNCTDLKRFTEQGVTWLECQECGAAWDFIVVSHNYKPADNEPADDVIVKSTVNDVINAAFDSGIYGGYAYGVRINSDSHPAIQVLMAGGKSKVLGCNKLTANAILDGVAARCKYTELVAVYPDRYKI
jgi:hypothetical protein